MCKNYLSSALILSVLCLISKTAGEDVASSNPAIDPKADSTLRQMSDYLAGATAFSFEAHKMTDLLLDTGQKIQLSDSTRAVVKRPAKIWAQSTGDTQNEQVWYNGTKLTMLNTQDNVYAVVDVPDNIDEMMDYIVEELGVAVPLADLLFSDPYKMVIENVRSGQYIGLHYVQRVKCHHLAFRQEGLDWQIWIQDGKKPLPRKLVITYKELPGHPQFIALLGEWDLSPQLPDDLFTFNAPEGAKQVAIGPTEKETSIEQAPDEKKD